MCTMNVTANNNDSCLLTEQRIWGISVQVSRSIQRPEKEMLCMSPEKQKRGLFRFLILKKLKAPCLIFKALSIFSALGIFRDLRIMFNNIPLYY